MGKKGVNHFNGGVSLSDKRNTGKDGGLGGSTGGEVVQERNGEWEGESEERGRRRYKQTKR